MRDHRSLEAWKQARLLTRLVLRASSAHWHPSFRALFSQLQRSSLSIQLNIAEGYSHGRSRTYGRYLGIAFGSLVESIEIIELLRDERALPGEAVEQLLAVALRCRRCLVGLLKHNRPMEGTARP